jgi:hypothetical protein
VAAGWREAAFGELPGFAGTHWRAMVGSISKVLRTRKPAFGPTVDPDTPSDRQTVARRSKKDMAVRSLSH